MRGAVARYFASIGFKVDKTELANIDRTLSDIEKKLRAFGKNIDKHLNITLKVDNVELDKTKLKLALGNALDLASKTTTFEVTQFAVDVRALRAALLRASRLAGRGRPRPNPPSGGPNPPGDGPNPRDPNDPRPQPRERRRDTRRDFLHAGGAFGALARYGVASIPFVGGAYGLSQLNKTNQEAVSARLTTKAVTEAAGLQGQGEQAFDWLRQQGHRIGFNYLDQAQDYNNYLSNSLGAGMDLKSAQNTYLGFAEYSKAMGTTPARQKLVMNALSQMMGKGVVSMEELKKQMAESMPGTMDVFATAYQKLLKAKGQGGDKTGQAALEQLYEDVPKRKLVTAELAPYLSEELRRRAAPKLDIAMQTSQSWQGRFGSTMADLAQVASANGVENGFKNIFRALTKGAEESDGMVAKLAKGFEKASDSAAKLLLWPASFSRALEGKDSQVADWLGIEKTKQLREDWAELSNTIKEVFSLAEPSWLPSLRSITESLQSVLNVAGGVSRTGRETKSVMGQIYDDAISDYGKYSLMGRVVGAAGALRYGLNTTSDFIATKASAGANLLLHHPILNNPVTEFFASPVLDYARNKTEQWSTPTDRYAQYWLWRESQRGIDTSLQYGNDPAAWRDMNSVSNKQVAEEVFGKNGTGINQPITRTEQNTNTFYMEFKFEKGDPEVMKGWFQNSFQDEINKAMPNFSYKE